MEEHDPEIRKKKLEEEKRRISILRSGNISAISEVIDEIREDSEITIIPEILEVMLIYMDQGLLNKCRSLLTDIKNKQAVVYITDALKDNKYDILQKDLVSACWQNGLDYSAHIDLFVDLLINSDYATAIEAFTVIENSLNEIEDHKRAQIIQKLENSLKTAAGEKHGLISEMQNVIRSF